MENKYIGKKCPYCKTVIRPEDEIITCSQCDMPHHLECWVENQGCTTFGCSGTIQGLSTPPAYPQNYPAAPAAYAAPAAPSQAAYPPAAYAQTPAPATQPTAYPVSPEYRFCTKCGTRNKFDNLFCTACGNRL